jgi:hypothetical protein
MIAYPMEKTMLIAIIATCDIFARAPIHLLPPACHAANECTLWRERAGNVGPSGGSVDELIGRLVADVGVDRPAAEAAVGIILDFLTKVRTR